MKEDKAVMDQKINQIGQAAVACLNNREFKRITIGLLGQKYTNEAGDQNHEFMELFFNDPQNQQNYMNALVSSDEYDGTLEEEKYLELQDLLFNFREYCASCGDEWQCMTLVIDHNNHFKIDFKYDPISLADWRTQNSIEYIEK